ncbi:MAG TPA: site-specific integrase, partial [Jiangellaceae bacterium]|nr:site-specific integrase [Jiangellaceae bacterium]
MADVFGGLLDSFTLALDAGGKSPKTVENYSRAVVAFARWLREHDLADDVTTVRADDVRGWLVSLKGNVSPSTEYRNYSGARQFFAWCVREGELDASPMVNVRAPKVPEPRTVMLTADQMRLLLAGCAGRTAGDG